MNEAMKANAQALREKIQIGCGVSIGWDDPLITIYVANETFVNNLKKHLENISKSINSNIEELTERHALQTKKETSEYFEKAGAETLRILNHALSEGRRALQETVETAVQAKTADVQKPLAEGIQQLRQLFYMVLAACCMTTLSAAMVLWASL